MARLQKLNPVQIWSEVITQDGERGDHHDRHCQTMSRVIAKKCSKHFLHLFCCQDYASMLSNSPVDLLSSDVDVQAYLVLLNEVHASRKLHPWVTTLSGYGLVPVKVTLLSSSSCTCTEADA